MKRILIVLLALLLALTFAACQKPQTPSDQASKITPEPTAEATSEPAAEPTGEPTAEPTAEPVTGHADYCMKLDPNEPFIVDIDFDGLDDTVLLVSQERNEYDECEYVISVTRGADPDSPKEYEVSRAYDCSAWVIDCDPEDSRLEVLVSYVQDSDDWTSAAMRVNDEGTEVTVFEDWCCAYITDEAPFTSEGGFIMSRQTDIFGTTFVDTHGVITAEGFAVLAPYVYNSAAAPEVFERTLKRDLDVVIVNEDGAEGEAYTVPAGEKVTPVSTDLETFLDLLLPDGRTGRVKVELATGDDWGVYINGVNQDEYAEMPYAD